MKILLKFLLFIFLSILFLVVAIFTYPRFYKTFMPLTPTQYSEYGDDKQFKVEQYFVPYLHHSLGLDIYPVDEGSIFYRVIKVQTGEIMGETPTVRHNLEFEFREDGYCVAYREVDSSGLSEDEQCISLKK